LDASLEEAVEEDLHLTFFVARDVFPGSAWVGFTGKPADRQGWCVRRHPIRRVRDAGSETGAPIYENGTSPPGVNERLV